MKKFLFLFFLLVLTGFILLGFQNRLTLTEYTISNSRIPDSFDGFKIAVVSDLHAKVFGDNQSELASVLKQTDCDLVCFSGDVVSHDATDLSPVWALIDQMDGIQMVYVAGNHELSMENYDQFLFELQNRGVIVLDDFTQTSITLTRGEDSIYISGYPFINTRRLANHISFAEKGYFNILLYHDPYCFYEAALMDYDLMISGHLHGGVARLPFIGSPLELFNIEPFTKGLYTSRSSTLIVSAGLGDHELLPRFFNDPEVVLISLDAKSK